MKKLLIIICLFLLIPCLANAAEYYVATTGSDNNPGTFASPWRTIQHAADEAEPGDTVYVRDGTFNERIWVHISGSPGNYITFRNYSGETPILDNNNASSTDGDPMFSNCTNPDTNCVSLSYIKVIGFTVRNFQGAGIFFAGQNSHIEIRDNEIYNGNLATDPIGTQGSGTSGMAIKVTGRVGTTFYSATDITIDGNYIHDYITGSNAEGETLTLGFNVQNFLITNNILENCTHIGISVVGKNYWDTDNNSQTPKVYVGQYPQYGIISGNTVLNQGSYSSDSSIYIDYGKDVTVENNIVIGGQGVGITAGTEESGAIPSITENMIIRKNRVYNKPTGMQIQAGNSNADAINSRYAHNTNIKTDGNQDTAQSLIYYGYGTGNVVKNNIFYRNYSVGKMETAGTAHDTITLQDYNIFYENAATNYTWLGSTYSGFSAWRAATGQDSNSLSSDPTLLLPTNRTVNGTFDTGMSGWTGWAWDAASQRAKASATTGSMYEDVSTVEAAKNYMLCFEFIQTSPSTGTLQVTAGGQTSETYINDGNKCWLFTSTSTNPVTFDAVTLLTGRIDNVVLTEQIDLALDTDSPAINAGTVLTTVVATAETCTASSSNTVVVTDARYFHDGYGICAVPVGSDGSCSDYVDGDIIMVGTDSVTVTDINYTTNTLTLSSAITCVNGEGVSYPYSGDSSDCIGENNPRLCCTGAGTGVCGPDMGYSEYGYTPPAVETEDPTVPTNVVATTQNSSSISLAWTASTDNVAVTGYEIYRSLTTGDETFRYDCVGCTTAYTDNGLSASTTYYYKIFAYDAAGNESALSLEDSDTTSASPGGVTNYAIPFLSSGFDIATGTCAEFTGAGMTVSDSTLKLAWDFGRLFFCYSRTDTNITSYATRDGYVWEHDGFQIFICPGVDVWGATCSAFWLSANGVKRDQLYNVLGADYAMNMRVYLTGTLNDEVADTSFIIKGAIPLSLLGAIPSGGTVWYGQWAQIQQGSSSNQIYFPADTLQWDVNNLTLTFGAPTVPYVVLGP